MVYVNRFTDQLPHCCGPEEGEEGEGGGRVEKNWGGAKLEGGETRKILRAPLRKGGGGGDKEWETQVYKCVSLKKGTRNILTRLAHLNYFFGFILADFTLLT